MGGIRVSVNAGAHLDITNCTITNNTNTTDTGGLDLFQGGTAKLYNTIVAENHGRGCHKHLWQCRPASSHNLVTDCGTGDSAPHHRSFPPGGAGLASTLANNGGQPKNHRSLVVLLSTPVHLVWGRCYRRDSHDRAASSALFPTACRHWCLRIHGAIVVNNPIDENDGNYSAGNLSLREALIVAAARPGNDTITFAPVCFQRASDHHARVHAWRQINSSSIAT